MAVHYSVLIVTSYLSLTRTKLILPCVKLVVMFPLPYYNGRNEKKSAVPLTVLTSYLQKTYSLLRTTRAEY